MASTKKLQDMLKIEASTVLFSGEVHQKEAAKQVELGLTDLTKKENLINNQSKQGLKIEAGMSLVGVGLDEISKSGLLLIQAGVNKVISAVYTKTPELTATFEQTQQATRRPSR